MPSALAEATAALAERLLALAGQDADLRRALRGLAQAVLELTDERAGDDGREQAAAPAVSPIVEQVQAAIEQLEAAVTQEAAAVEEPAPRMPLPELTLGRTISTEPARPSYPAVPRAEQDLALIEARCRLKAEGARWAATRRRRIVERASFATEIEPLDRDIIARAKQVPNCFLWMCHSTGPTPTDLALYEKAAGCFEAVAEGVSLIRQIEDEPEPDQADFEAALDLLAEAQSGLRIAVAAMDGPPDHDQNEVFHWLRTTATVRQIFIQNYMRLDAPADPNRWPDLLARIESVALRLHETERRRRDRKRLLGKVRHKATLILNQPDKAAGEWDLLIAAVAELVGGGLPASNRELREMLLPVIEVLPEREALPRDFERVLAEIDRYLATVPPPESPATLKPTPQVTEAAELLRGKSLVLIGGDKRPGAYQALKQALGLKELIWIETRAHESVEGFGPYVARPDVAAVLLAIRWSSHSYGEVKSFCERHGKPLVRLPGGYSPNQAAAQILAQASQRLK